MLVSGSFLSDKLKEKDVIKLYNKSNLDYIHYDVMDGKFVPNKNLTIKSISELSNLSNKKCDIHLMVKNPLKYIDELSLLNVEYITFHYEAVKNHLEVIEKIKNNGIKCGIAINPSTSVKEIEKHLNIVDMVLVMSVNPGLSGQSFMESVIYKLEILRKIKLEKNYNYTISIDGGINNETFNLVKDYVDMVVSASYLMSGDVNTKVDNFKCN